MPENTIVETQLLLFLETQLVHYLVQIVLVSFFFLPAVVHQHLTGSLLFQASARIS